MIACSPASAASVIHPSFSEYALEDPPKDDAEATHAATMLMLMIRSLDLPSPIDFTLLWFAILCSCERLIFTSGFRAKVIWTSFLIALFIKN